MANDIIKEVNDFYNKTPYVRDKTEYWQTPSETKNGGDCEDIAIAKYFSLIDKGIDRNYMKFAYINDGEPHMVLLVNGMVLDNKTNEIKKLDKKPVYEFNHEWVWYGDKKKPSSSITQWRKMMERMNAR